MLKRKITNVLSKCLSDGNNKIPVVDGARQTGKTFIIRHVGQTMFANYVEINMEEDKLKRRLFAEAKTVDQFKLALSSFAGDKLKEKENTLVFIDEIQAYDHLLTLLKFLKEDGRYTYIASGSLLGVTLNTTQSIPIGSIDVIHLYPLDFEEFLWANGFGTDAIDGMKECFVRRTSLSVAMHNRLMELFRTYLLVGGLPDAVNTYLQDHNIVEVRKVHKNINLLYTNDAAKYEKEASGKLKIQRIYSMIPSSLENKKRRIVVKDIDGRKESRTADYQDEFDYLIASGVALDVKAISQPTYPLVQNAGKNLLKLYLNDVGLFTNILYRNDILPVLKDTLSINLGAVYETVIAQELKAHGFSLYYYDNKKLGEVDYLIDDPEHLSTTPIEVKSGKDYKAHSSLTTFVKSAEYNCHTGYVLSHAREVTSDGNIIYIPVYFVMFFNPDATRLEMVSF